MIVTVKAHRGAYQRPVVNPTRRSAVSRPRPATRTRRLVSPLGHDPIRHTTLYWHFLDAVWIVMFSVFLFLR